MNNILEAAYYDKLIKKLAMSNIKTNTKTFEDVESISIEPSPIIVKADVPGNKNEKVITSILRDENDAYRLQHAYIPPFNRKGSVYPFSFLGSLIKDSYVNSGTSRFLRYGEKQSFDTFVNCRADDAGIFPSSLLNKLQRSAITSLLEKRDYRGLYYLVSVYLTSMANLFFGHVSNTGGSIEGNQLVGKTSFQVPKTQSSGVFSLNEGTPISSGFYRNNGSQIVEYDSSNNWKDESCQDIITDKFVSKLERLEFNSKVSDSIVIPINDGYKGWCSFWLDISKNESIIQKNLLDDFESYVIGADPVVVDPAHWAYVLAGGTWTVQNWLGTKVGRFNGAIGITTIDYTPSVTTTLFPMSIGISFNITATVADTRLQLVDATPTVATICVLNATAGYIYVGSIAFPVCPCIVNTVYNIKVMMLNALVFDIEINNVLYTNGGSHFTMDNLLVYPFTIIRTMTNGDVVNIDNISLSWSILSGYSSWLELSETRLFVTNARSIFYFTGDRIVDSYNTILYEGIDFKKSHRVTLRWDYTDPAVHTHTFQLDDLDPKVYEWEDLGSALINNYSANAIKIASSYSPISVFGIVQSGDWFPWVWPEINKQFFNLYNLNLMESLTGVLGPFRREYKNEWTTMLEDFKDYYIGEQPKRIKGWNNWNSGGNGDFIIVSYLGANRAYFNKNTVVAWTLYPIITIETAQPNAGSGFFGFTYNMDVFPTASMYFYLQYGGTARILIKISSAGGVTLYDNNAYAATGVVLDINTDYRFDVEFASREIDGDSWYCWINDTRYGPYYTYQKRTGNITNMKIYPNAGGAAGLFSFMLSDIWTSWTRNIIDQGFGFKNLHPTQRITDQFDFYQDGNVVGQGEWTAVAGDDWNGTTILHDVVTCRSYDAFYTLNPDKKVLKIYDTSNVLNIDIFKQIFATPQANGRLILKVWPTTSVGESIKYYLGDGLPGTSCVTVKYDSASGNVFILNDLAVWIDTGLSLNLDAVNVLEIEWSMIDRNGDGNPDCRVFVNGVYSVWIRVRTNPAVGIQTFRLTSSVAVNGIIEYLDDITAISTGLPFPTGKEVDLAQPDGEWIEPFYLQQGRALVEFPSVRFTDTTGNGLETRMVSDADYNTITDHRVDEINVHIPLLNTNYRYRAVAPALSWLSEDIPNHWLPSSCANQRHPKYPLRFISETFYDRYKYCYSTVLLTQLKNMLTSSMLNENCAELEYLPLVHPFLYPNNIGVYIPSNEAMPEKFSKCPQRMRKVVDPIDDRFAWAYDGQNVTGSSSWTDAGAIPCYVRDFKGSKQLLVEDQNAAAIEDIRYTFPLASQTIPGVYSISFDITVMQASSYALFALRDAGAVDRIYFAVRNTGFLSVYTGGAYVDLIPYEITRKYKIDLVATTASTFHVYIDGIKYDNGGADWPNQSNFASAITMLRIWGFAGVARLCKLYVGNIDYHWKPYPDYDQDDFIIHPSYLGHARPIEVVNADDQWGFRDYGKYTALSNDHPTKFWINFFLSSPWEISEQKNEIIVYDTGGREMLYLITYPLQNADVANYPKEMWFASDSAESTTGLTLLDGSWTGWLPVTLEIDAVGRSASIYFHDKLVAGGIPINAGLTGLKSIVFSSGYTTWPTGMNKIWRDEDFQSYGQGVTPGPAVPGWTITVAGTTNFYVDWNNGDAWGKFYDVDGANTLTAYYDFPVASMLDPDANHQYSIKWSQRISSLANNGYVVEIISINPPAGDLYIQFRADGLIWNDNGGGLASTGIMFPWTNIEHEVIIQFVTGATFNIYINGVLQNAAPLTTRVPFAGAAGIQNISFFTAAGADDAVVYFNNIDESWRDMLDTYDEPVTGGMLVDGVKFSAESDRHTFMEKNRFDFMLPYRDYVNPHHSTFHNNLNGTVSDIIPLPPYHAVPPAAYNTASWTTGNYWDYYSALSAGMYAGPIRNWYAWKFPYIFGGLSYYNTTDLLLRSCQRLFHTVPDLNKATSGKWEFVLGAVVEKTNIETFERFAVGNFVGVSPQYTFFVAGGSTATIVANPNNLLLGKWLKMIGLAPGDSVQVNYAVTEIPTLPSASYPYTVSLDIYIENLVWLVAVDVTSLPAIESNIVYFSPGGSIDYLDNMHAVSPTGMTWVAGKKYRLYIILNALGTLDLKIKDEGNNWQTSLALPIMAWANRVNTIGFYQNNVDSVYFNNIKLSWSNPNSNRVVVTGDMADITGVNNYVMNQNTWMMKFIENDYGNNELWINDDSVVVPFSEYADGYSIPTAGSWSHVDVAPATTLVKDDSGNKVIRMYDNNVVGLCNLKYQFTSVGTRFPIFVSFKVKVITSPSVSFATVEIRDAGGFAGNIIQRFRIGATQFFIEDGIGTDILQTYVLSTWYKITIVFIDQYHCDVFIDNNYYDHAGAHYDLVTAPFVSIACIGLVTIADTLTTDIYLDDFAASWLQKDRCVAVFNNRKELHKYTVDWDKGRIKTSIDGILVDESINNGDESFYFNQLKMHVLLGGMAGKAYGIMFGAQCDNESNYRAGCLDWIPGGTMENEGATGQLVNRNDGIFALENSKDLWNWENLSFWKRMSLNASSLPVLTESREIQDILMEYGKSGLFYYTMSRNNVENYLKVHTNYQVGPKNTDMEVYGKFFSLYANDFTKESDKTTMNLFDCFTFTHGYTLDLFQFTVLALVGSLARLFGAYAIQSSQIIDNERFIHETALVANQSGYVLRKSYNSVGPKDPIDIGDARMLVVNGLLHRRDKPTITNLKSWLAILFGLNVEYITFTEKINTAEVEIFVPYPQALGVFNQLGWKLYLEHFLDKFRPSGITFKYTDIVFTKSENASGKWSEGYAQVSIT